jgi:hypothetical protein
MGWGGLGCSVGAGKARREKGEGKEETEVERGEK